MFFVFVLEIRNLIDKIVFFFQSFTLPLSKINLVQNSAFRNLHNHMDLIPSFFQLNVQSLQLVVLPKPHQTIVWHHRTDLTNRGKTWVGDTEKKCMEVLSSSSFSFTKQNNAHFDGISKYHNRWMMKVEIIRLYLFGSKKKSHYTKPSKASSWRTWQCKKI